MHMSCSNLQQTEPWRNTVSRRCTKDLDDPLHSAGKPPCFLTEGYDITTASVRAELDMPKIEMGTAVVINNLWSILNNSKCSYLTDLWSDFSCCATYIYVSQIVPASSIKFRENLTNVMGVVKKHNEDIGIICTNQDLRCVMPTLTDLPTHLRS